MPTFTFETKIPLPETAADLHVRLQSLFAIKDALDKEIESLIGRRTEERKPYHCVRCDHKWYSRLLHRPQQCPVCRTKKFDTPPAFTYEEKLKRKQEKLARTVNRVDTMALPVENTTKEPEFRAPMPHSVITRLVYVENERPDVSLVESVTLAPPPVLEKPLSLRERLAQMSKGGDVPSSLTVQHAAQEATQPASVLGINGAAADGAHLESNESVSDDELVEAINNGTTPDE